MHAATHPFEPFLTPVLDACERLVHACQPLPTRNVAQQSRATVGAHVLRSGEQPAAEHAGSGNNHGLRKGGGRCSMMEAFASMGARIVQHSVPARDEATRSCQLRRPGHAHWRGTGAQMRKGGKTGWGEGDHDRRCL
eukprot:COSAG01_NODE_11918_length_1835_cov_117.177995_2_plen_137_part_00